MRAAFTVFLGLILLMPALAHAGSTERYGYWGLDLLGTEMIRDDDALGAEGDDDSSAALRLHGGYRANRWLGLEGAAQGLGRYHADDNRFDYSALTLSGMLYLPVTRTFELYARVGAGIGWVRDRDRRETNSKPLATAGLGTQFHVTPVMAVRAGVDGYALRPRIVDGDGNADVRDQRLAVAYLGISLLF